jgi:hypothetical protein
VGTNDDWWAYSQPETDCRKRRCFAVIAMDRSKTKIKGALSLNSVLVSTR